MFGIDSVYAPTSFTCRQCPTLVVIASDQKLHSYQTKDQLSDRLCSACLRKRDEKSDEQDAAQ
jgi:hypothetical protein